MKKIKILNAISLNMIQANCKLSIKYADAQEIAIIKGMIAKNERVQNAIGHSELARIIGFRDSNRISVTLESGETAFVAQYKGERLPEGATELPLGASIKWVIVGVDCPAVIQKPSFEYNDGLRSGGRNPLFLCHNGEEALGFSEACKRGVVTILSEVDNSCGKWSSTTYQLSITDGWHCRMVLNDLHDNMWRNWSIEKLRDSFDLHFSVVRKWLKKVSPRYSAILEERCFNAL